MQNTKPKECGKWISLITFILAPLPIANDDVVHSPTPSNVNTAAVSKGEG